MSEVEPSAEALKEGIAVGPPGVPVVSNEPLGDKVQETRKKEETVDKAPANPETLENETVAGVPAEAQPLAQAVITPAKLSEMVLVNVVAGRLKVLPRLITLLGAFHITCLTRTHSTKPTWILGRELTIREGQW